MTLRSAPLTAALVRRTGDVMAGALVLPRRRSLFFDGVNDGLALGTALSSVFAGTNPWTLALWEFFHGYSSQGSIFNSFLSWGSAGASAGTTGCAIHGTSTGVSLQRSDGSGTSDGVAAAEDIVEGWHHLAATYDGATLRLYLDGVAVGTPAASSRSLSGTAQGLYVHRDIGSTRWAKGNAYDPRVYSEALSAAEIASLAAGEHVSDDLAGWWPMTEGTGATVADASSGGNDGTISGAAWSEFGAFDAAEAAYKAYVDRQITEHTH